MSEFTGSIPPISDQWLWSSHLSGTVSTRTSRRKFFKGMVRPSAHNFHISTMSKSVVSGLEDAIDYQFDGLDLDSGDDENDDDDDDDEDESVEVEFEAPEWKKSKARDYLYKLCLDPTFPSQDDIRPKQVWEEDPWKLKDRPEFVWFQDYSKFAERLRSARTRAGKKTVRAKADAEALKHDRSIFPERTEDAKGEPIWQGSKAQELLRRDLQDDEKMKLRPKLLQLEEEEYLQFSLENFRDRIYSERKAMQRIVYIKKRRAKKKEEKKKKAKAAKRKAEKAKKKAEANQE